VDKWKWALNRSLYDFIKGVHLLLTLVLFQNPFELLFFSSCGTYTFLIAITVNFQRTEAFKLHKECRSSIKVDPF